MITNLNRWMRVSTLLLCVICMILGIGNILPLILGNPIPIPSDCYPEANPLVPHYLIGYGSLINIESRRMNLPSAKTEFPIRLHGYQRSWNARGRSSIGYNITFLGALENKDASFNGVLFQIPTNSTNTKNTFASLDFREDWYCRKLVPRSQVHFLKTEPEVSEFANADIWIYITRPGFLGNADKNYPITSSYVDTYLGGCIDIENKYNLKGFSEECISSTTDWTTFWINNRKNESDVSKIDQLLKKDLEIYPRIQYTSSSTKSSFSLILMLSTALIIRISEIS